MNPYIGEIRAVGFGFPPKGWAACNGQLLPIAQNQALFSILGTTYGGDGRQTFALPNLQGKVAIHVGDSVALGQSGGTEAVTLTTATTPAHVHTLQATTTPANDSSPGGDILGGNVKVYAPPASPLPVSPSFLSPAGQGQTHSNMQPYLAVNYIIALVGVFPSRS